MVVLPYLVPFGAAFLTCLMLGPWARRAGRWLKAVDQPQGGKLHSEPVARSGGLAIGAGLLIGSWAGAPLAGILDRAELMRLAGVTLAAGAAFMIGLLDDIIDLSPRQKILGSMVPPLLLTMLGLGMGEHHSVLVAAPVTFALILGAMNSVNLLDGMDGLAAGVTVVASLGLAAYLGAGGSPLPAAWALALGGAAAGFLTYNLHPSSLFMGDGGSFLCGFGLAYSALEVSDREFSPRIVAALVLMLVIPIADTAITGTKRLLTGRPLTVADQRHTYHLLLRRGMGQRTVLALFVLVALGTSTLGLVTGGAPRAVLWLAGGFAGALVLVLVFRPVARRKVKPPEGPRAAMWV